MLPEKKRILYCVLNWGLGHATRSAFLIQELLNRNTEVIIASEGRAGAYLQSAFPALKHLELRGMQVKYPTSGSLNGYFARHAFRLLSEIQSEHQQCEQFVKTYQPHAILSDNRYGAWSKRVPSVFIGHQLQIQSYPLVEKILLSLNGRMLRNFNRIWVPDLPGDENITGALAHRPEALKKFRPRFIGLLSRFRHLPSSAMPERYELVVILSGPEPRRSAFEKSCIEQCLSLGKRTLILQGKPDAKEDREIRQVRILSHLPAAQLKWMLEQADYIVSRSGHTTLMDLAILKKSALCIPTPGQTEQEYLANYLGHKKQLVWQAEEQFDLAAGIKDLHQCSPLPNDDGSLLQLELDDFIRSLDH